jgi:preprotein translocase subunit SecA
MRDGTVDVLISQHIPPESVEEQWDIPGLEKTLFGEFGLELPIRRWLDEDSTLDEHKLRERVIQAAADFYNDKFAAVEPEAVRHYERAIMLNSLDSHWREHLSALDHLRQGIHLRGYAQKNPKQEYKREAFELFSMMLETVRTEVTRILMTVKIKSAAEAEAVAEDKEQVELRNVQYQHADYDEALEKANSDTKVQPFVRPVQKVGRNDPCPCGSGKKYKQCHGKLG